MSKNVRYILLEDEHISALGLKRTVSRLRPDWSLLAESDCTAEIPKMLNLTPDLILSDIFLCDGVSADVFEKCSCTFPIILFSGYPEAKTHCKKIPNLISYIEKPVAHTDLEKAFSILECAMGWNYTDSENVKPLTY